MDGWTRLVSSKSLCCAPISESSTLSFGQHSACSAKGKVHMPILYNAESMLWLGSINPTRRKMYLVLKHTVLNAFCYTQVQNTFSV